MSSKSRNTKATPREKYLVYGFIRELEKKQKIVSIPRVIIHICIIYQTEQECIAIYNAHKVQISSNKKCITLKNTNNPYIDICNCYGLKTIKPSICNKNVIYTWCVKATKMSNPAFGIAGGVELDKAVKDMKQTVYLWAMFDNDSESTIIHRENGNK